MSALQQVILHPYLSQTVSPISNSGEGEKEKERGAYLLLCLFILQLRFWSTTVGRDKTYRSVQYLARFLAWYEYRKGATKETVARLTNLKTSLGLSRKCESLSLHFDSGECWR